MKSVTVGITGGIGSGKTLICRIFEIFNVPVYHSDDRAKTLMNEDPEIREQLIDLFGKDSYTTHGLNRKLIASQTFKNPDRLASLNLIVHPKVRDDFKQWVLDSRAPLVMKESALLFETGGYKELDHVVTVTAPERVRIQRVLSRDEHRSTSDILDIISNQWKDEQRIALSSHVIVNDDRKLVLPQVLQTFKSLNKGL